MWILLTLALSVSDPPAPRIQDAAPTPEQHRWFQDRSKPFGSSFRIAPAEGPLGPAPDDALMNCTLRILKADPKLDSAIARPAPENLDPKIVRPSRCRK